MARFVDTNILVYAEDREAGDKHKRAVELLQDLWESGDGVLSIQVLQEFFVTITKKVEKPIAAGSAKRIIEQYLTWRLVENSGYLLLAAIDRITSLHMSFWDALIVEAALSAGCDILYSEDLAHKQHFGNLQVINPFKV